MRSSRHQVTLVYRDVPGQSWNVPHGILWAPSHTCIQGCFRTVLECPSWDPLNTKSHLYTGMSQDCPGTFFMGFSWHKVTLYTGVSKDCPGMFPWDSASTKSHQLARMSQDSTGMSLMGSPGHQGLSWDIPHGILRTPSHTCIQGCST